MQNSVNCLPARLVMIGIVVMLGVTRSNAAATHYVVTNGTPGVVPTPGYTTWDTAATNIQAAIDYCSMGDIVIVSNGIYNSGGRANYPAGSFLTNRVVITNAVTVRALSTDPADTLIVGAPDPATLGVGTSAVRCVYMDANCALIGFTISNGYTCFSNASFLVTRGGGIYCSDNDRVISNCYITSCYAWDNGGGAFYGAYYNCTFSNNHLLSPITSGYRGGAGLYGFVYGQAGNRAIAENCTIVNNTSSNTGGGCFAVAANNSFIGRNYAVGTGGGMSGAATTINCLIAYNTSVTGGGGVSGGPYHECLIASNLCLPAGYGGASHTATMRNCTLDANSANNNAAMYGGNARSCLIVNNVGGNILRNPVIMNCTVVSNSGTIYSASGGNNTTNCIIYGNRSALTDGGTYYISYSCAITNGHNIIGNHNITNNPMFVSTNTGNYRLCTRSPCIDTGLTLDWMTNSLDLDGNPRLRQGLVDMGAYEWWISHGAIFTGR